MPRKSRQQIPVADALHLVLAAQARASSPSALPPPMDASPDETAPESTPAHAPVPAPTAREEFASDAEASAAEKVFLDLYARCADVPLKPGVAAYYERLFDRNACLARGRRIATAPIVADAIAVLSLMTPVILDAPLPGFGPMRLKHTLDLAVQHLRASRALVAIESRKAGAASARNASIDEAREGYRHLHGLLDCAVPAAGPARASLAKAHSRRRRTIPEVTDSLQALDIVASDLFEQAAQDPAMAEALDDMGVTPDELASTARHAASVHQTSQGHNVSKADLQAAWDTLNTLDGVMWFLLEQIQQAAERARRMGRRVPAVRLTHVEAVVARSRGGATETSEPDAPTPTPDAPDARPGDGPKPA